jgi:TetR/AcrR family transcriptional regulator, transcriptional repressor for nem operon
LFSMPRERNFSEAQVIDQAADVFSAHGYGGTSVAMLADATGLGKQSLYNTFGDKQALYLKAVDCAAARYGSVALAMRDAVNGRAALQAFFDHLVDVCASNDPAQQSCIVSSGLLEGIDDVAVRVSLQSKWQSSHELLRAAIERGQRDGSVKNHAPSAQLADMLMSLMSGLRVTARVDADPARLAAVAAIALKTLDQP